MPTLLGDDMMSKELQNEDCNLIRQSFEKIVKNVNLVNLNLQRVMNDLDERIFRLFRWRLTFIHRKIGDVVEDAQMIADEINSDRRLLLAIERDRMAAMMDKIGKAMNAVMLFIRWAIIRFGQKKYGQLKKMLDNAKENIVANNLMIRDGKSFSIWKQWQSVM